MIFYIEKGEVNMIELEKIEYAKSFIDKLANGINPLDDTPISETDIVNNVRLSRCFFYVSDILRQVIEKGGINPPKKPKKQPFNLNTEQLNSFPISEIPLSISEVVNVFNNMADLDAVVKLKTTDITSWLVEIGLLEVVNLPSGKTTKRPTVDGEKLGIFLEDRIGKTGPYSAVMYDGNMQQFIVDNFEAFANK